MKSETAGVHALLRICAPHALSWEDAALDEVPPDWTTDALRRLPFVVVRRNSRRPGGWLPVGIRGSLRSQRAAAWLPVSAVRTCVTPRMLAAQRSWRQSDSEHSLHSPAVAVLDQVEAIVTAHGFAGAWGPGGSVGAELASGVVCTHAGSDLDLLLYADAVLDKTAAGALHAQLSALPVRVDTLLEMPLGGVALADLAGDADRVLLRTAHGPRLM
jgi:phosphoribosyl-dephospho-CoA transferase